MSAINVVRQRDRVHVVTDGAGWLPDGRVATICPKAHPLPHASAVVATRGPASATINFGARLGMRFGSFDEIVAGIEGALPQIHAECRGFFAANATGDTIDVILAGWSAARGRPESYLIRTSANVFGMTPEELTEAVDSEGCYAPEPYKLTPIEDPVVWAPVVPRELRDDAGFDNFCDEKDEQTLFREMITLLELQRSIPFTYLGNTFCCVGGFVQVSTVTNDGITQRIIHRWPDRLGELIKPERIDWKSRRVEDVTPATVPPAGMSKLQRDMWHRRQRKVAAARGKGPLMHRKET